MKKLFTLLSILGFTLSLNAQNLSVHPKNSVFYGPISSYEIVGHGFVKNVSGDSVITWVRIENNLPNNWTSAICDKNNCYAPEVGRLNFILQQGDSSIMDVHIYPANTSGVGTVSVMVWSGTDSLNADTLNYEGNVWANSIKLVKAKEVNVYPNPANKELTLSFKANSVADVIIYDVLGNKQKSSTHTGNLSTIDVSDLKPGIYFIRVIEDGKTYSRTFKKI